jgi:hypothetical protein
VTQAAEAHRNRRGHIWLVACYMDAAPLDAQELSFERCAARVNEATLGALWRTRANKWRKRGWRKRSGTKTS